MDIFKGRITSSGFASGDRIVIGDWQESILGSFTNLMWARSDGTRILLSPSEEHAELVSELYNFEEVNIVEFKVERGDRSISVRAGGLYMEATWGMAWRIPFWRPLWFTAFIEGFFSRILFRTKTHGRTKSNRRAWYSVRSISRIVRASAKFSDEDLGESGRFVTTACFGFSEPPAKPSSVSLKTYIK